MDRSEANEFLNSFFAHPETKKQDESDLGFNRLGLPYPSKLTTQMPVNLFSPFFKLLANHDASTLDLVLEKIVSISILALTMSRYKFIATIGRVNPTTLHELPHPSDVLAEITSIKMRNRVKKLLNNKENVEFVTSTVPQLTDFIQDEYSDEILRKITFAYENIWRNSLNLAVLFEVIYTSENLAQAGISPLSNPSSHDLTYHVYETGELHQTRVGLSAVSLIQTYRSTHEVEANIVSDATPLDYPFSGIVETVLLNAKGIFIPVSGSTITHRSLPQLPQNVKSRIENLVDSNSTQIERISPDDSTELHLLALSHLMDFEKLQNIQFSTDYSINQKIILANGSTEIRNPVSWMELFTSSIKLVQRLEPLLEDGCCTELSSGLRKAFSSVFALPTNTDWSG